MIRAKWYVLDVNPEPWAIGKIAIGRNGGKYFPIVSPNKKLVAFQNAVREELSDFESLNMTTEVELKFFFWRQQEKLTRADRTAQGNLADATNCQKALEDALQGTVFLNDRLVRSIKSEMVEQGPTVTPRIVIRVAPWLGFNPDEIPDFVWNLVGQQPDLGDSDNSWGSSEEVF